MKNFNNVSEAQPFDVIHETGSPMESMKTQDGKLHRIWPISDGIARKYAELWDSAPWGCFLLSKEGKIIELNLFGLQMLGIAHAQLIDQKFELFISDDSKPSFNAFIRKVFKSKTKKTCEVVLSQIGAPPLYIRLTGIVTENNRQALITVFDITDQKIGECFQQLSEDMHKILSKNRKLAYTINRILNRIKDELKFESVKISIIESKEFPDFEKIGYSFGFQHHVSTINIHDKICFTPPTNNSNIILECTCGLPFAGRTDPENFCFTKGGSAWTNNSPSSIALVPFRVSQNIVGLMELNDNRKDSLSIKMIKNLERITADIGFALMLRYNENTFKESEKIFHSIFENNSAAITIIEPDSTISQVNEEFCRLSGFKKEEIVGKKWTQNILPKDRKKVYEYNRRRTTNSNEPPSKIEFSFQHKNGESRHALICSSILSNKQTVASFIDITNRKQAEDELRKLSHAIEQSPSSIVITDLEGNIVYGNPKICELTGYSIEELLGKNLRILQSGETPKATYKELWHNIISGKEWRGEFLNKKKNGELYWESAAISPIFDTHGKITNFLGVKEDITEKKKSIALLEEAIGKAEAGNRLKSAFINNISHEIRTPLNGILGFSNLITQPDITEEDKEQFQWFIKKSSNRLLSTITNFMDISLIASGNVEVKKRSFNLNKALQQLWDQFQPMCANNNLEFHLKIPKQSDDIVLYTDPGVLHKTLSHLLDNSFKFTNAGEISFGYTIKSAEVEFFVKDTGVGISREFKHRVFDSFIQEISSVTRTNEGSGLGLSIANGNVQLLGGKMRLKSETDKGSTFFFTIPHKSVSQESHLSKPEEAEGRALKNQVILIAEDDEANFVLLEKILGKLPVTIYPARNGKEAVEKCRKHPEISLVLMDVKMPVMDGLTATREIKSFRKTLPIIALTAFAMSGDEKRVMDVGCDDYIPKPINIKSLMEKLKRFGIC